MNLNPSKGVALVTDGSSSWSDRSGGWAWVALDSFDGIHTASGYVPDTTNNRMEMTAVISGLVALYEHCGESEILVYSDSEYVVLGASDRARKRNKNKDLWAEIDLAIDLHILVEFNWVRGHTGHEYNELADELAGLARKEGAHD